MINCENDRIINNIMKNMVKTNGLQPNENAKLFHSIAHNYTNSVQFNT